MTIKVLGKLDREPKSVLVRVLQENRTTRMERERMGETERDFKELAHEIMGAGKSEFCRSGQKIGGPGNGSDSANSSLKIPSFLGDSSVFSLKTIM